MTDNGIIHESSCAYTSQQNGVAERKNRHILEVARTMMIHGHVPNYFWADAVLTACYLINRMPSSVLDGVIPYNVLFPSAPLFPVSPKIFGCVCYVYDNRPSRTKLDPKSIRCLFVGYSGTQKGYRCYSPAFRRYFVSSDVIFMESVPYFSASDFGSSPKSSDSPPLMTILSYSDSSSTLENDVPPTENASPAPPITQVYTRRGQHLPVDANSVPPVQDHETCASPGDHNPTTTAPQSTTPTHTLPTHSPRIPTPSSSPHHSDLDLPIALRKGSRNCPNTRYPLDRFCSYAALSIQLCAFTTSLDSYSVPTTVSEALQHPEWFRAMQEEMSTLWKNET